MKRPSRRKSKFTASISREGRWYVAQCLEIDVASQGRTEREAFHNLREALALHLEQPSATLAPTIRGFALKASFSQIHAP